MGNRKKEKGKKKYKRIFDYTVHFILWLVVGNNYAKMKDEHKITCEGKYVKNPKSAD